MDVIKGHKLEQVEGGYNLLIYLNTDTTEFAEELGSRVKDSGWNFNNDIDRYIEENFNDIKILTIKLFMGAALIATIALGGATTVFAAGNESPAAVSQVEVPSSYTVQPGDGLWLISQRFGVSIEDIKKFNNLMDEDIKPGQKLYLKAAAPVANAMTRTEYITHVVQSGESLWTIAKKYGISVDQIKNFNQLNADTVKEGQTLKVLKVDGVTYTVKTGESLWAVSRKFGVSVDSIKLANNMAGDTVKPGQELFIPDSNISYPIRNVPAQAKPPAAPVTRAADRTEYVTHTVKSGDSLWTIAQKYKVPVEQIKSFNALAADVVKAGQIIKVIRVDGNNYTVKAGDSLWTISQKFAIGVDSIKLANNMADGTVVVGKVLFIPNAEIAFPIIKPPAPKPPSPVPVVQTPVYNWPAVTYIVRAGDTAGGVARKFGMSVVDLLRYNYMTPQQWLDEGDKIAISGYAPRTYTVKPGEAGAPARVGKVVDWVTEGQYLLKRGDKFLLTDVNTGSRINVKMMGGYNHSDIEPLTTNDTNTMRQLFGTWRWMPRSVVVFKDGMNIAASLSGMPHGAETIYDNGVSGHFDLYLLNSTAHKESTSQSYVQEHYQMIMKAAGR